MGKKVEIQEGALSRVLAARTDALRQAIEGTLGAYVKKTRENLEWIFANMPPYFFITMQDETEADPQLGDEAT